MNVQVLQILKYLQFFFFNLNNKLDSLRFVCTYSYRVNAVEVIDWRIWRISVDTSTPQREFRDNNNTRHEKTHFSLDEIFRHDVYLRAKRLRSYNILY